MCGLFGALNYGKQLNEDVFQNIISLLGVYSSERGTDATGIAYLRQGKIIINKAPKEAVDFDFTLPKGVNAVMGHVRLTTHGSEKRNMNNHPFSGRCSKVQFALAHKGVLLNYKEVKKSYRLPKTLIETDSYVAVQLLEKQKELNLITISEMTESLLGSYCFSILDSLQNLFIVRGSNPIVVLHHKKMKTYFYASTEQILWKALVDSKAFDYFKNAFISEPGIIEEIFVESGNILKIDKDGKFSLTKFRSQDSMSSCGEDYWLEDDKSLKDLEILDYIEQLKHFAVHMGLDSGIVEELIQEGYSMVEIEQYIYGEFD